jgi:anthranilate phosphoribosyltransferase
VPIDYSATLSSLIAGNDLSGDDMRAAMDAMMDGELTPAQIGAFLVALRIKGETVEEISAAALSMRDHATFIDAGPPPIVDTCGTGGDGAGTYNISTTAAFVAAGAGVKIAKHGNRAASSKSGSADVLKELGVNIEATPDVVAACVREVGIGFLFAVKLHGAMRHAIGPRRELGIRTVFNMLGPMTNPARATAQVIGVFDPSLTEVFANVLNKMGSERAMIVHGSDGLDEITVTGPTQVSELKDGVVRTWTLDPMIYIGTLHPPETLAGGEPADNAAITREILGGATGAKADIAVLNAAAAIYVGGAAPDYEEAVEMARDSLSSGAALAKLDALVARSNAE